MKKIILCNGDSLGMPREDVSFRNTWYYLLLENKNEYYCVNNFRRGFNTNELSDRDFLENYEPDIVILQVGIVDCAPRYLRTHSIFTKLANRLPASLSKIFWIIVKKTLKRTTKKCDVPLSEFQKNITNYLNKCKSNGVEKIIIIKIQRPGLTVVKKNPKILNSIEKYNIVLDNLKNQFDFIILIDPLKNGHDEDYINDGYHINSNGSQKVYNELVKIL